MYDLLTKENYFDKNVNGRRLRLHVSNKLVFGKPYRIMRLPFENKVLNHSYFDESLQANNVSRIFNEIINIFRTIIDKPHNLKHLDINEFKYKEIHKLKLGNEVLIILNEISDLAKRYHKGEIGIGEVKEISIKKVKVIKKNEIYKRFFQNYILKKIKYAVRFLQNIDKMPKKILGKIKKYIL